MNHCTHHEGSQQHEVSLCIYKVPIFNHLTEDTMRLLMEYARPTFLHKGELLYRSGEQDNALYIVHKGRILIYQLSQDGKQQLIRILNPGDFTGELTLFSGDAVHEDYAEAALDSHICVLHREDVQALLAQYPSIAIKILEEVSRRLMQTQSHVSKVATVSISRRLIMYLEGLMQKPDGNEEPEELILTLPMSRRELASYLGTSPESISRKFTEFEQEGLIEQVSPKKIRVIDIDGLLMYGDE